MGLTEKGSAFFPQSLTPREHTIAKTKPTQPPVPQSAESSPRPVACRRGCLGSRRWTASACRWPGVNGYIGVRAKQGRKKDKYQGVTPRKHHRTGPYETPKQAAVALAHLRHDLDLGVVAQRSGKNPQPPAGSGARKKLEVGTYLGHLLRLPPAGIPTVACALLSQQEAAEAVARGVAVAYARVRA